jgi:hypothetical protein
MILVRTNHPYLSVGRHTLPRSRKNIICDAILLDFPFIVLSVLVSQLLLYFLLSVSVHDRSSLSTIPVVIGCSINIRLSLKFSAKIQ